MVKILIKIDASDNPGRMLYIYDPGRLSSVPLGACGYSSNRKECSASRS